MCVSVCVYIVTKEDNVDVLSCTKERKILLRSMFWQASVAEGVLGYAYLKE